MKKLIYLLLVLLFTSCEKSEVEEAVPAKPQPQQPVLATNGCAVFYMWSGGVVHTFGVDCYIDGQFVGTITKYYGSMFEPNCSYTNGIVWSDTYEGYHSFMGRDHLSGAITQSGGFMLWANRSVGLQVN